uniref:Uncharacterized protein n=1 Tax=Rhizophora mucronata TaxID=61149 RepID=A0A2P2PEG2_RHIMU
MQMTKFRLAIVADRTNKHNANANAMQIRHFFIWISISQCYNNISVIEHIQDLQGNV